MKKTLRDLGLLAALYLAACWQAPEAPQPRPHLVCAYCQSWVLETDWNLHMATVHNLDTLQTDCPEDEQYEE